MNTLKKPAVFFLLFIFLLIAGFSGSYWCTHTWMMRPMQQCMTGENPELLWLKKELHLSESQFKFVENETFLYRKDCWASCQKIMTVREDIKNQLASGHSSEQLDKLLTQDATLQKECRSRMLTHIFRIANHLNQGQKEKYLHLVSEELFEMHHRSHRPSS